MDVIKIDGSLLEGGGQIFRNAITLSAITKTPVIVSNIRAGRSKGGLMEQHLKGLELVKNISNARVRGAHLGSSEVEFYPGHLKGGSYSSYARTAGSISLQLQIALPCALFSDSNTTLNLGGGTNCEMAPQIDYMTEVFRPVLKKFGAGFDFDLVRRGYFPKGGGEVAIHISPVQRLEPVEMVEQGEINCVYGWSYVAGVLPISMANRLADAATERLKPLCRKIEIERYKESKDMAQDNCAGIVIVAETSTGCILGGSALGNRKIQTEETGRQAADEIVTALEEGACLDKHNQDQVIIFMALAKGKSRIRVGEITMHTKTSIYIAEQMTKARFEIIPDGKSNIIECSGSP